MYLEFSRSTLFHRSAIKIKLPVLSVAGKTNVLCAWKVVSAPGPLQGLSNSFHGPNGLAATA